MPPVVSPYESTHPHHPNDILADALSPLVPADGGNNNKSQRGSPIENVPASATPSTTPACSQLSNPHSGSSSSSSQSPSPSNSHNNESEALLEQTSSLDQPGLGLIELKDQAETHQPVPQEPGLVSFTFKFPITGLQTDTLHKIQTHPFFIPILVLICALGLSCLNWVAILTLVACTILQLSTNFLQINLAHPPQPTTNNKSVMTKTERKLSFSEEGVISVPSAVSPMNQLKFNQAVHLMHIPSERRNSASASLRIHPTQLVEQFHMEPRSQADENLSASSTPTATPPGGEQYHAFLSQLNRRSSSSFNSSTSSSSPSCHPFYQGRTQLIGWLDHEIRNSLHAIGAMTETLKNNAAFVKTLKDKEGRPLTLPASIDHSRQFSEPTATSTDKRPQQVLENPVSPDDPEECLSVIKESCASIEQVLAELQLLSARTNACHIYPFSSPTHAPNDHPLQTASNGGSTSSGMSNLDSSSSSAHESTSARSHDTSSSHGDDTTPPTSETNSARDTPVPQQHDHENQGSAPMTHPPVPPLPIDEIIAPAVSIPELQIEPSPLDLSASASGTNASATSSTAGPTASKLPVHPSPVLEEGRLSGSSASGGSSTGTNSTNSGRVVTSAPSSASSASSTGSTPALDWPKNPTAPPAAESPSVAQFTKAILMSPPPLHPPTAPPIINTTATPTHMLPTRLSPSSRSLLPTHPTLPHPIPHPAVPVPLLAPLDSPSQLLSPVLGIGLRTGCSLPNTPRSGSRQLFRESDSTGLPSDMTPLQPSSSLPTDQLADEYSLKGVNTRLSRLHRPQQLQQVQPYSLYPLPMPVFGGSGSASPSVVTPVTRIARTGLRTPPLHSSRALVKAVVDYRSCRVLVVDDSVINVKILSRMLSEVGLSVYTANDGLQAVELVRKLAAVTQDGKSKAHSEKQLRKEIAQEGKEAADLSLASSPSSTSTNSALSTDTNQPHWSAKRHFDIILSDVNMPIMSGLESSKRIRQLEAEHGLPKVPIIAVTANTSLEDREACAAAGMDYFVGKPFVKRDVMKLVEHILENQYVCSRAAATPSSDSGAINATPTEFSLTATPNESGVTVFPEADGSSELAIPTPGPAAAAAPPLDTIVSAVVSQPPPPPTRVLTLHAAPATTASGAAIIDTPAPAIQVASPLPPIPLQLQPPQPLRTQSMEAAPWIGSPTNRGK